MSTAFDTPDDLLAELRKPGFRPSRKRGQNFLKDPSIARKIIAAAEITRNTAVLEIGPGLGALPRYLITQAGQIIAVEIDDRLSRILEEAYGTYDHLTVLNQNVLDLNFDELIASIPRDNRFVLLANLPYCITGPILDRLMTCHRSITHAVLMIQREVGERLTASPGTKAYGAITVIMRYYYKIEILFHVSGDQFVPRPAVESVVLRFIPHDNPPVMVRDVSLMTLLIKSAFQHRRKMLHHAVNRLEPGSAEPLSDRTGINLKRRGETLDLVEFSKLSDALWEYRKEYKDHS